LESRAAKGIKSEVQQLELDPSVYDSEGLSQEQYYHQLQIVRSGKAKKSINGS